MRYIKPALLGLALVLSACEPKENNDDTLFNLLLLNTLLAPAPIIGTAVVTTFAGSDENQSGYTDGTGLNARFSSMKDITIDNQGSFYVTDSFNRRIRKITSNGEVSTLAGSGSSAVTDGTGTAASFQNMDGITVNTSRNVFVGTNSSGIIRKISPAGVVTTIASITGFADGAGTSRFTDARYLAMDSNDNLLVADSQNHAIRRTASEANPINVTTIAGAAPAIAASGYIDATGNASRFFRPTKICIDPSNNIYVADNPTETNVSSSMIRKISPAGVVTTFAGSTTVGNVDAVGTSARFQAITAIACDKSGNVFVADGLTSIIRKITPDGVVSFVAGGNVRRQRKIDGTGSAANLSDVRGLTFDSSGNLYGATTNSIFKLVP